MLDTKGKKIELKISRAEALNHFNRFKTEKQKIIFEMLAFFLLIQDSTILDNFSLRSHINMKFDTLVVLNRNY